MVEGNPKIPNPEEERVRHKFAPSSIATHFKEDKKTEQPKWRIMERRGDTYRLKRMPSIILEVMGDYYFADWDYSKRAAGERDFLRAKYENPTRQIVFLRSDYCDPLFTPRGIECLVTSLFQRWLEQMDPDTTRTVGEFLSSDELLKRSIRMLNRRKIDPNIALEAMQKVRSTIERFSKRQHGGKSDSVADLDSYILDGTNSNGDHLPEFSLMIHRDLKYMSHFIRLSPTMIRQIMRPTEQTGVPPLYFFLPDVDKMKKNFGAQTPRMIYTTAFLRMLAVNVFGDLANMPELYDPLLWRKCGFRAKPSDHLDGLRDLMARIYKTEKEIGRNIEIPDLFET